MRVLVRLLSVVMSLAFIPFWIMLCAGVPFALGSGLNRLLLRGRGIDSAYEFFGYVLGV